MVALEKRLAGSPETIGVTFHPNPALVLDIASGYLTAFKMNSTCPHLMILQTLFKDESCKCLCIEVTLSHVSIHVNKELVFLAYDCNIIYIYNKCDH